MCCALLLLLIIIPPHHAPQIVVKAPSDKEKEVASNWPTWGCGVSKFPWSAFCPKSLPLHPDDPSASACTYQLS